MSDQQCPGGNHPKPIDAVCCDPCWDRAPRLLPIGPSGEMLPWRRRRAELKRRNGMYTPDSSWREWERITTALVSWLRVHHMEGA